MHSVRRHGFVASARHYGSRLHERVYERRLGIRSSDLVSLRELGLEHEERRQHYPTALGDFRRMEQFLRPRTRDEVLLDYGSGLGRMLILAAMLPFKRVIGVELSPMLASRARENLSNVNARLRCKNVEIIVADATAMELPRDVTMIYFNYPFSGKILEGVLSKIAASYNERPRSIRLVCNLPPDSGFESIVDKTRFLELEASADLGGGRLCRVFSLKTPPMTPA
jgi:SAM-dependent methyltransferase